MGDSIAAVNSRNDQAGDIMDTSAEDDRKLANDTIQMLNIFPEEIWFMITDNVTDPNDLENVSNASLYLRNILLPKRTLFLFPKVWQIFESKFHKQCKQEHDSTYGQIEAMRFLQEYGITCTSCGRRRFPRSYSGILKLRLICKTWNSTIDSYYESRRYHYKLREDNYSKEELSFDWLADEFREDEDAENFTSHFRTSHQIETRERSPFISRDVHLISSEEDNLILPPEDSSIFSLLLQHGHHIRFATVYFEDPEQLSAPIYSKIREWLILMPALKTLRIEYCTTMSEDEVDFASEELQAEVSENSMPVFEDLQYLRATHLPSVVFNSLIRRNNHVSLLEVEKNSTHGEYDFYNMRIPNLEELAIAIFNQDEFQTLGTSEVHWPLRKLYLDFENNFYIEWRQIFSVISDKWSNTLETLAIKLPEAILVKDEQAILNECSSLKLNLPRLQRLKVTMSNLSSLDFLLSAKESLEILDVVILGDLERMGTESHQVEEMQQIQFVGYHKRLHESNIWSIFPKLKEVSVSQSFNERTGRANRLNFIGNGHFPHMEESWSYSRQNPGKLSA